MRSRSVIATLALSVLCNFPASPAHAWNQHQLLMRSLGRTTANLNRKYLYSKIQLPSPEEERKMIHSVAEGLELNEKAIPVFTEKNPGGNEVVLYDLFRSEMIDEPDQGMDRDLPDSADAPNDRPWMGGKTGMTSQGFRHMYFPGFDYKQPGETLQFPFRALGQAPMRYQKLMAFSDKLLSEGQKFWGVRTLLWALHYLQDMHQPFHVTQVPLWHFLPLRSLFSDFRAAATHALNNYQLAYEDIAVVYLKHYDDMYFRDCFEIDKVHVSDNLKDVADKAREEGKAISPALYELLGPSLKRPEIDFVKGIGKPDMLEIVESSRTESAAVLRQATCRLFQSIAQYTWGQFDRAFNYVPETSSNRGR